MRFCNSKHNPLDQIGDRLTDIPEETPATSPQRHVHRKALSGQCKPIATEEEVLGEWRVALLTTPCSRKSLMFS